MKEKWLISFQEKAWFGAKWRAIVILNRGDTIEKTIYKIENENNAIVLCVSRLY